MTTSTFDRFVEKVDIQGPDDCWEWTAGRHPKGYGHFSVKGKIKRAHRVAWELTYDEDPGDLHVLHSCDNPACCNPDHLFLGTNDDNVSDKVQKGRQSNAALTESDVVEILSSNDRGRKLASKYNVDESHISHIRSGSRWAYLQTF